LVKSLTMNNWAVIKANGKQYKVEEGETFTLDKVKSQNDQISFDEVLLVKTDKDLLVGRPLIQKAKVTAKILGNYKDKKIRVVKFKSKSRYLKTTGHRQQKTKVMVEKIYSPN